MPSFQIQQGMLLSMHGRESIVDSFRYTLAEKLGRTVEELEGMSHREYVGWQAFYMARGSMEGR